MKRKYLLILGLLFVMLEGIIMQSCKVGFKKEKGKCVDEDECKPKLICGENASCFNTDGSYYCQCQAGFKPEGTKPAFNFTQGDGIECKDINECVEKNINCGSNAKCENTVGGYYCTCESGFTSSSGNKTSSTKLNCVDINECVNASINCGLNAECVNNQGGYACRCRTGYAPNNGKQTFIAGQGVQCDDIDECEDENTDCGSNAECENTEGGYYCTCESGVVSSSGNKTFLAGLGVQCVDINECVNASINCGPNAECVNNQGGYACICRTGYAPNNGNETFIAGQGVQCGDRNECDNINCGKNAMCHNTPGHFYCSCSAGFTLKSGETNFTDTNENCESVCDIDKSICGGGTCKNTKDGHECLCSSGFTNSGHKQRKCTEFDYETFKKKITAFEANPELAELVFLMNSSSEALKQSKFQDGEKLLEKFLNALEGLLRDNDQLDNKKASAVFNIAESMLKLTGLMLTRSQTKKSTTRSDVELLVKRESSPPVGPFKLSTNGTWFTSHWDTATGNDYMGFTTVALLSYTGLEESLSRYFNHLETQEKQTFKINSEIVTATVSNKDTAELKKPVHFKFSHLKKENVNHICVFWDHDLDGGAWSTRNCSTLNSTAAETVCSCSHLSSFAVLMALYDIGDVYELRLISWVGLSLSLVCLLICIVTFYAVRSIQSTRNTIHMHLCISLFIAYFVFLVGISRTENKVGCSVVAGVLHYFFLASFCWMCLEGVQLFRMVVLVFNTTLRHIYMFAAGYGVPALIVAISASVNASGYGTPNYCWLNIDDGFIWSFYGPVCIIIVVNVFFFLITIWKLAEKFSSLNPDLDNLRKIKAFIVTAIAQLCVLGIMWVFGCFQFDSNSLAVSYIFTILGSLQGVLMFIMHCWLSKQVRDEYAKFLSCICAPQKRKYSEFSSNQTSKSQASKSVQHTGESQI